jgi:hypothetical protein
VAAASSVTKTRTPSLAIFCKLLLAVLEDGNLLLLL